MALDDDLTKTNRPLGSCAHNNNWRHRAAWYGPFQDLGTIEVVATANATEPDTLPVDHADAHILWSYEDDPVPERNKPLDYFRTYFLQDAPVQRHRNGRDVEQYNHLVRNLCGGPNNTFEAETMKDLHFFLKHVASRNAIDLIRHIYVKDMTAGPLVADALTRLSQCTGLQLLTLRICRGCKEYHSRAGSWIRWQNTTLNVDRGVFQLDIKRRAHGEWLCNTCQTRQDIEDAGGQPAALNIVALNTWRATEPAQLQTRL